MAVAIPSPRTPSPRTLSPRTPSPRGLSSFDVFDTVLVRTVGDPGAVSEVVARDLRERGLLAAAASPVEAATWAAVRREVEARLPGLRRRPPTLAEVHEEVARCLGMPAACAEATLAAELDVERRLSRAVPGIGEAVAAARERGDVAFVSDTPLPAAFLAELLARAGLLAPTDRVFSSADEGVSKIEGGRLFAAVAAALGRHPADCAHAGDNRFSDVAEPRLRGWRATHRPGGALTRYEELLERHAAATGGVASALAGASRLGRLRATVDGVPSAVAAVASGVATPLLVAYGLWVLREARLRGLRRLYFLSRDGEVMLDVVRALRPAVGAHDVDVRYLYGSRAAWQAAGLATSPPEEVREVLRRVGEPTARLLAHRVGLDVDAVRDALGAAQAPADPALRPGREDEPLSPAAVDRLARVLTTDPVLARVREAATGAHGLALDHLRQEGLGDGTPYAVVDSGWMGRTVQALDDMLAAAGVERPAAYLYVGRSAGAATWSRPGVRERQSAFLFDEFAGRGVPGRSSGVEAVVEVFCAGREGTLRGYRRDGDRVVPVLARSANDEALAWGLDGVRATVRSTVEALLDGGLPLGPGGDLSGAVDALLRAFWETPTPGEVAAWGTFPLEAGDDHRAPIPLAAPVRAGEVARGLRARRVVLRPAFSWRAGTAALSGSPWRPVLQASQWYDDHGARARRAPRRLAMEWALRHGDRASVAGRPRA